MIMRSQQLLAGLLLATAALGDIRPRSPVSRDPCQDRRWAPRPGRAEPGPRMGERSCPDAADGPPCRLSVAGVPSAPYL